ncbi:MAG: cytochrome P450 [Polyangiales bacterium]
MADKKHLTVLTGERSVRVAWYAGATDASIERALRQSLALPDSAPLTLADGDGDVVALSDSLPSGLTLRLLAPSAPSAPTSSAPPQVAPGPPAYPLVGSAPSLIGSDGFMGILARLTNNYGHFARFKRPRGGGYVYVNSDADVVQDMAQRPDDFRKTTPPPETPLGKLRLGVASNGLFTSGDDEEIWQVAHRILLPAFGTNAIRQYYGRMLDVAFDLVARLDRTPADEPLPVTDLMTRMTFEAIAFAGFDTRFGAVEAEAPPPFVQAMVDVLTIAQDSVRYLLPDAFHPLDRHRRDKAAGVLAETVDALIRDRRAALARGDAVPNDMLQVMLTSRDKVTGKRLPDDNIRAQLVTFLIAGHETTSGLLSYALYRLATNPAAEEKLVEEVDRVFGRDYSYRPTWGDIERLDYTARVLKEALRLDPTAPGFVKFVQRDTVVAGRYAVEKGATLVTGLRALHRNKAYWGDDPERFDPDRFLPEAVAARHPHAYHPFGLGIRSCIGFQFALVEARMVLAMLYQRYRFRLAEPDYQLEHVQTLTTKPRDLFMTLERRAEARGRFPTAAPATEPAVAATPAPAARPGGPSLLVLFGSNMGAAQDLAQSLARAARAAGVEADVAELDSCAGALPTDRPVAVVTSTYNGAPPDNAARFLAWLDDPARAPGSLAGVTFAVLGCGNKQWQGTFQRVPRRVDERLRALGATALCPRGECDADGDFDAAAEAWTRSFTEALRAATHAAGEGAPADDALVYAVEVVNFAGSHATAGLPEGTRLHGEARLADVLRNDELQSHDAGRSTRHVEVALPEGVTYAAGDHLGVFPENAPDVVDAVAERCGVRVGDVVVVRELRPGAASSAGVPLGVPLRVGDLLRAHVDLSGPLTRRELRALAAASPCPPERVKLEALAGDATFRAEVLDARLHLLDVLARFPSVQCSLALVLSLRPTLKPRYYSIASSPRVHPRTCHLTVGVHTAPRPDGSVHEGVCSHHLARTAAGAQLRVVVRDTGGAFRLPADPSRGVILVGPGTGFAPLRGFLEERASLRRAGVKVGPTSLYFGCRRPDHDWIYRDEMERWLREGDLDALAVAFSREPGHSRVYVQDLLRRDAATVFRALEAGASVYVCGDAKHMAPDVERAFVEAVEREARVSREEAQAYVARLRAEGRYLQDVWAAT